MVHPGSDYKVQLSRRGWVVQEVESTAHAYHPLPVLHIEKLLCALACSRTRATVSILPCSSGSRSARIWGGMSGQHLSETGLKRHLVLVQAGKDRVSRRLNHALLLCSAASIPHNKG
jgi:hypothetical protein